MHYDLEDIRLRIQFSLNSPVDNFFGVRVWDWELWDPKLLEIAS